MGSCQTLYLSCVYVICAVPLERAKVCVLTLMCRGGPLCDASSYIIFLWVLLCFGSCLCRLGRGSTLLQPLLYGFCCLPHVCVY
eukprot:jgi/Botrbrau1/18077/Bobra.0062s0063.1